MSASATSLALSSLNPKSLSLFTSKPASASLLPLHVSYQLHYKPLSVSLFVSSTAAGCFAAAEFPSRFVRNVAVSSDFGVDEDGMLSEEGEDPGFSPDLKLFVGNLPFSVDSAQLAGLFESAGNVEMVEVIYDKVTGRSRGFGFVTMSTVEEVEAAAQQFNGYELEGRPLRVNSGPPPPRREVSFERAPRNNNSFSSSGPSNRVYVGNLAWAVDDMALESLFSEQGKVIEAKVIYDRDSGRSKGFGFVTYSSSQEVGNAIESLNGVDLDGRQIRVSVAESRPPRRQF